MSTTEGSVCVTDRHSWRELAAWEHGVGDQSGLERGPARVSCVPPNSAESSATIAPALGRGLRHCSRGFLPGMSSPSGSALSPPSSCSLLSPLRLLGDLFTAFSFIFCNSLIYISTPHHLPIRSDSSMAQLNGIHSFAAIAPSIVEHFHLLKRKLIPFEPSPCTPTSFTAPATPSPLSVSVDLPRVDMS